MTFNQAPRQGGFIEHGRAVAANQAVWPFQAVALEAIDDCTESIFASRRGDNPRPLDERGAMSDMLAVAAFQIGNPVA